MLISMGRHTIGNKRGSVRGAPPSVYVAFGTYTKPGDKEPWRRAFELCKDYFILSVAFVVLSAIGWCLWIIGLLPDGWVDYE